jgi:predicted GIY-YIG superfamily endonuclease
MTTLYRAYDSDGRLLYVGIAENVEKRIDQHLSAPWARHLALLHVQRNLTRVEAGRLEREAIRAEWPLWNVQGSPFARVAEALRGGARTAAPEGREYLRPKAEVGRWLLEQLNLASKAHRIALRAVSPSIAALLDEWDRQPAWLCERRRARPRPRRTPRPRIPGQLELLRTSEAGSIPA